jgi:hypothetical protein
MSDLGPLWLRAHNRPLYVIKAVYGPCGGPWYAGILHAAENVRRHKNTRVVFPG